MSRRFPSALPGWETIREPPPSSEASSDDELQSISQSQPIRRRSGDSGPKRRLSGQKDTLPKPKKQRLGQSGNGNDSVSTIEPDRIRVPSLTQPVPSTSWSCSTNAPAPKRVQMRKPTGENYPKRLDFSAPNFSKLTKETSKSKPVPPRLTAKQPTQSNSTWGTSDRQDRNEDDVLIISSSSSASPVPTPARMTKGKGKARQTSPQEQTNSQLSLKAKGKARITLASSGEDDQDITSVRYGQLQRKESDKARTEKTADGKKRSGSTVRNKGLRVDGRPSGSTMVTERVTTKPMKRSKAEKERRKSLGDAFSTPSDGDQGNVKAEDVPGSASKKTVQSGSNVIQLSSDEEPTKTQPKKIETKKAAAEQPEPKKPDVIEISDVDTPPLTQRRTSLPAIIDLTLDDEPVEEGGVTTSAVLHFPAGRRSSAREESICRNALTNGSTSNLDLEDNSEIMMATGETPMMDIVSENVDNRTGVNIGPSNSTSRILERTTELSSTTSLLKDEVEPSSSETGTASVRHPCSPQVKQQSMSPAKGNYMTNLSTFPSTPQPALGSPHPSPKKDSPSSPQKSSPLKPERASRHVSEEFPSSLGSPPILGEDQTPPSTLPSSCPPERQKQTLPSLSLLEPSAATLDLDPSAVVLACAASTANVGGSKPSPEHPDVNLVKVLPLSTSNLHSNGTEIDPAHERPTETASSATTSQEKLHRNPIVRRTEKQDRPGTQESRCLELSQSPRTDMPGNKTGTRSSRTKVFTARKSTGAAAPKLPPQASNSSPSSSPPSPDPYITSVEQAFRNAGKANAPDQQLRRKKERDPDTFGPLNRDEPQTMVLGSPMKDLHTKTPSRKVRKDSKGMSATVPRLPPAALRTSAPSTSLNINLFSSDLPSVIASEDKIAQAKARWHALPPGVPNVSEKSSCIKNNGNQICTTTTSVQENYSSQVGVRAPSDLPSKGVLVDSPADEHPIIDLTIAPESSDDEEDLEADTVLARNLMLALERRVEPYEEDARGPMAVDDAQESLRGRGALSKFPSPSEQLSSELASTLRMDGPLAPASVEEEDVLEYLDEKEPEPLNEEPRGGESPALVYPEDGIEPIHDDIGERNQSPPTPSSSASVPEVPVLEEELSGRVLRSRSASSEVGPIALRRSARACRGSRPPSSLSANTDILNISPQDDAEEQLCFGGLTVLTWGSFRSNLNNFQPKCYWSTDLPHAFHDHINWLSEDHRNNNQMRHILESIIIENTSEEPHAPPISIKNQIDSTPTPQWEFYYTNKMWHSPSVPAPSVKRLGSCGCIGKCQPDTCACAERQKKYTEHYTKDFVYDKQGCLLQGGIPIFECNSLCRCDDDCVNRVVQNGRKVEVSLFKTAKKGWGVVNGGKKIPRGQFIGVYSGEYLTQDEAETRGKVYNKFGRTYLFDCDLWIFTGGARYTIDAYHAGNFTRFLNHSCDPNAHFGYVYIDEDDIYKPLLCVFARRDIAPHEEITFSYTGDPDAGDDDDDGESSVKKKKVKKGPRAKKSDTVYSECHCGARKCKGFLFN